MVERRQEIHKWEHWMVQHSKSSRAIHVSDGVNLSVIRRKGLLQIFRGMDALSIHCGNFEEQLQLGSHYLQVAQYKSFTGSDTKGRRGFDLLHGILLAKCNLRKEQFCRYEFELPYFRIACTCLFQHIVGK